MKVALANEIAVLGGFWDGSPLLRVGIITGLQGTQAACRSAGNGPVATESGWSVQERVP